MEPPKARTCTSCAVQRDRILATLEANVTSLINDILDATGLVTEGQARRVHLHAVKVSSVWEVLDEGAFALAQEIESCIWHSGTQLVGNRQEWLAKAQALLVYTWHLQGHLDHKGKRSELSTAHVQYTEHGMRWILCRSEEEALPFPLGGFQFEDDLQGYLKQLEVTAD